MAAKNENPEEITRQRSVRYPRHTLEKAEYLARTIFEQGARNCDIDIVAQAAGYKNSQNGAFSALRASTSIFGFVRSSGGGHISLTEFWIQVFNSENYEELQKARRFALNQPALYKQIISTYEGRQLPNLDRIARDLHLNQQYGMTKDAAPQAAQTFLDSAKFAGVIDNKGFLRLSTDDNAVEGMEASEVVQSTESQRVSPRVSANVGQFDNFPTFSEDLDRIEIKLLSGSKVYLFVPVPLPYGEKERIKKYIDLLLEEPPPNS